MISSSAVLNTKVEVCKIGHFTAPSESSEFVAESHHMTFGIFEIFFHIANLQIKINNLFNKYILVNITIKYLYKEYIFYIYVLILIFR